MSNEEQTGNEQRTATIVSIGTRMSPVESPVIGWIASVSAHNLPYVDYEGNKAGPLAARRLMLLMPGTFASMAERRQEVLLVFERNDPLRPIITGFLSPRETEEGAAPELVVVEGARVRIDARDDVSLVCGEGAVTLRGNGRVFVSGTNVTVDSLGVARVRGADTEIG